MARVKTQFASSAPRPARRSEDWAPEERFRLVMEASRLGGRGAWGVAPPRGIHEAVLAEWKATVLEALGPQKEANADSRRVRELEKQLCRKDKALAERR
jgi:hypothetical protein